MDLHPVEYYCHRFSYPAMNFKGAFAKRGNGPQELVNSYNIRVGKKENIWCLDAYKKSILEFFPEKMSSIQEGKIPKELITALDFDFYNDSIIIVPDYTGESRFCLMDLKGNVRKKYFSIPTHQKIKAGESKIVLAQAWRPFLNYNQENGILALVTQLGEVIEIYDMHNDTIVNIMYGKAGEPAYDFQNGHAVPTGIMGYSDVFVGKENIYAIFWGYSFKEINRNYQLQGGEYIHVFDLKGNPLKEYKLDHYVSGFHVDEDNKKFIALALDTDQPVVEYSYQ
ncbi:MAG: TolB-like 6-bladed beta-propeller domain-containing protein [Candidatus Azobacteroides sp.]|nr:TolB-like 6-bladed beta-propeller domain-containing protein [Candidatus Azobacteroides sp.]